MSGGKRTLVIGGTLTLILMGILLMWAVGTPPANVDPTTAQGKPRSVEPHQTINSHPDAEQAGIVGRMTDLTGSASAQADELRRNLEKAMSSLPQSVPAPDALMQSLNDALHAYASESISHFETYCGLHGIASFDSTATDPAYVPYMWSQFHAWFKTAIVNHDEIAVRWRVQRGMDQTVDDVQSVRTASRDGARAFWMQAEPRDRNSIEIVFPMVAKDLDGVIFESRWGLEFGHDPATGNWVLLRSRQYDVPASTRIVETPV
jgi:hypothetical protein